MASRCQAIVRGRPSSSVTAGTWPSRRAALRLSGIAALHVLVAAEGGEGHELDPRLVVAHQPPDHAAPGPRS